LMDGFWAARPEGTDGWSEAQLRQLVSRDSMIGLCAAMNPADLGKGGDAFK
jgi:hypothetical protein